MEFEKIQKIMRCFNGSFINSNNELIINSKVNSYFLLSDCKTELDLKRNVLEWLSRAAFKTVYCNSNIHNQAIQKYHRDGINAYLGTNFTVEDIGIIYCKLGNAINSELCVKFIESGYDMKLLEKEEV